MLCIGWGPIGRLELDSVQITKLQVCSSRLAHLQALTVQNSGIPCSELYRSLAHSFRDQPSPAKANIYLLICSLIGSKPSGLAIEPRDMPLLGDSQVDLHPLDQITETVTGSRRLIMHPPLGPNL